ncbi:MAG: bifunctional precorrin-2 dehydrogenase/sirohydrochlorin ferrochelatase [Bacteroidetes bacterium]|nr:bifunctional precorrin-2 dehydrogenase/sirohydrochlorin ferrochelatase [Bacteroidota bacterium]
MEQKNYLFPIFLKAHQIRFLIVGGGYVCEEKLNFLLKSSPLSQVTIVAPEVRLKVLAVIEKHAAPNVKIVQREFQASDINGHQIVIAATCIEAVNAFVKQCANAQKVLVNVADDPPRCDFYMGGIVNKGNVKIAISTNGKSPTLTKRLRQFFEEMLPDEIDDLAETLNAYRNTLKKDFETKVSTLNQLTKELIQ